MGNIKHNDAVVMTVRELERLGFDVGYTEEPHFDIDILATTVNDRTLKIVVRVVSPTSNYTWIDQMKFDTQDQDLYMAALYIKSFSDYELYLLPATVWALSGEIFKFKKYDKPGQISKPEFGISFSQKNIEELGEYRAVLFKHKL